VLVILVRHFFVPNLSRALLKGRYVTSNDDDNVAELIEINLMFAQMELALGGGDAASTLRALDHIMEALRHLRDDMPGAFRRKAEPRESAKPAGDCG